MINDAFSPRSTKIHIIAARENNGILDGNTALVAVAVERPCLQLSAGKLPFVHEEMVRVAMMVAFLADTL